MSALVLALLAAAPGPCVERHYVNGYAEPFYVYDLSYALGRLMRQTQRPTKNDRGTSWTLEYDEKDRLVRQVMKDIGVVEVHEYDARGREVRIVDRELGFETDPPRRIRTYTFDEQGRKVQELDDLDGNGRPNRRTLFEYDKAGHLVKETSSRIDDPGSTWNQALNNSPGPDVTTHTYDSAGDRVRTDTPGGHVEYDYGCWKASKKKK